MYIKVVQDTLKIALNKTYSQWAMKAKVNEEYTCAGYKLFTKDAEVIDATIDAREIINGFSEYFAVIGKSKSGYLAMDNSGNLYACGKGIKRIDATIERLHKKGGTTNGVKG